jgi:hypothetical protein
MVLLFNYVLENLENQEKNGILQDARESRAVEQLKR